MYISLSRVEIISKINNKYINHMIDDYSKETETKQNEEKSLLLNFVVVVILPKNNKKEVAENKRNDVRV